MLLGSQMGSIWSPRPAFLGHFWKCPRALSKVTGLVVLGVQIFLHLACLLGWCGCGWLVWGCVFVWWFLCVCACACVCVGLLVFAVLVLVALPLGWEGAFLRLWRCVLSLPRLVSAFAVGVRSISVGDRALKYYIWR